MKLVKTNADNELLQYPFSVAELRKEYPSVSFPAPLTQGDLEAIGYDGNEKVFNYYIVTETKPPINASKLTHDQVPSVVPQGEGWVEVWSLVAVSEEEAAIRAETHLRRLDYKGFWKAFVRSSSYSALKSAATVDLSANVLATELISVFSDAKSGNVDAEAMQVGISEAVTALEAIDPALKAGTEALLTEYGLDAYLAS